MTSLPDARRMAEEVLRLSALAAAAIREVYEKPFAVEYKEGDDPVTQADKRANDILCEGLERAFPGVPVVAEESDPGAYAGFRAKDAVWFVDPLDGTRDFVQKNGEFAVMIGLAVGGRATFGVIEGPADRRRFVGGESLGAFEVMPDGVWKPVRVTSTEDPAKATLYVSRSRPSEALAAAARRLGVGKVTSLGSAGLKALRVASGAADLYAHLGRAGYRWDACAPEAIVVGAGGTYTDAAGAPYDYKDAELGNVRGVLVSNGKLHARALAALGEELAARGLRAGEGGGT